MNLETGYREEPQKTLFDFQCEKNGIDGTEKELDCADIYMMLERDNEERINKILNDPEERDKLFPDDAEKRMLKIEEYEEMYDPGLGEWSTVGEMEKFYGKDLYEQYRQDLIYSRKPESDRPEGQVSKSTYSLMKSLREGKNIHQIARKIKKETQIKQKAAATIEKATIIKNASRDIMRKRKEGDDYYLKTERGLIKNPEYREIFKGPSLVYEWLWANLVRHGWNDTEGYPLKEHYYQNGLLACSASFRHIAKECGMNKNKVTEFINYFEENGIIKIEHLMPAGKNRGQNVYILGEWKKIDGDIEETFYRDQVFLSEKKGKDK